MVVVARPDILAGIRGYLRSFPELAALVGSSGGWKLPVQRSGPRISSAIQGGDDGWKMPTRALVVRRSGGPVVGADYALGLRTPRFDTFSYGARGHEAEEVWAMLDAIMVPTDGRAASFAWGGVRIGNVVPEAEPTALTDPAGWPYVFAPYVFEWSAA